MAERVNGAMLAWEKDNALGARLEMALDLIDARATIAEQAATIARLEGENTRLGVVLSGEMHTVRKLQSILRYLRPALPVLQSMLSIARMDSNKAAEMLREIDAALKEHP